MSYPNAAVSFPGLFGDWRFTLSPKLLDIGNGIYWYGVLIAAGLLLALWFCMKRSDRYGLTEDNVIDTVLWAVPFAIVGARAYYVLFYLDLFRNADGSIAWSQTYRIWDGGLAIYGGILAAFLTAWIVCRVKRLPFWAMTDCAVAGFFIGQSIGRWGNFFNREAFGSMTDLPWRMRLWLSESYFVDVHPTFLYESLWNLVGLIILLLVVDRARRFDGQNTCFYFLWYGVGRFWIEGLRTDSLYLFDLTLFGERVRVSQALSLVVVLAAAAVLITHRRANPARMFVYRRAAEAVSILPAEGKAADTASVPSESPTASAQPVEPEASGEAAEPSVEPTEEAQPLS